MSGWTDALQRIGWVGLGGFLGANARYWLGVWIQSRWDSPYPWSTFLINVTGSFALGLFLTLLSHRLAVPHAPALRLLVAVGFLGGYTTFSTFELETLALASARAWLPALANAVGSVLAGFLAVWLGVLLGRTL